jgi:CubicO group peptidase (beta-lactamase class C family)
MSSFGLSYAPSETLGFIPERLERLTAIMARQVDEKKAPGVSMLIARYGKIAYRQLVGVLRPGGPAMTDDAIFRIYSMTKPIVSVAAMMLVEEGRLLINDPVSKFIPAFANTKVGIVNGDKLDLAPLKRAITVQDLMRHTSGLTYGFTGVSPVQKLIKAANVVNANRSLAENVEAMAALPLMHQPGEAWEYSVSTDVLGRVVEVIEGVRLGEVLRARVLEPLRMVDTAFFTPESKLTRRADPFSFDFMTAAGVDTSSVTTAPKFESGGGGLMSTLADYTRFAAMLSGRGAIDGVRILGAQTQAFMASDHLGPAVRKEHVLLWPGHGFGLGFAVRTDPGRAPTAGSVGEFFWGGMMGTAFWVSPRDSLFAVLMVQTPENREYFRMLFRNLVTAALA